MESGAKGCEVIVSGKLRAQRAKAMKFKDGFMVSSGEPVRQYIDSAVRHVMLRQGVLGIKVCNSAPHVLCFAWPGSNNHLAKCSHSYLCQRQAQLQACRSMAAVVALWQYDDAGTVPIGACHGLQCEIQSMSSAVTRVDG